MSKWGLGMRRPTPPRRCTAPVASSMSLTTSADSGNLRGAVAGKNSPNSPSASSGLVHVRSKRRRRVSSGSRSNRLADSRGYLQRLADCLSYGVRRTSGFTMLDVARPSGSPALASSRRLGGGENRRRVRCAAGTIARASRCCRTFTRRHQIWTARRDLTPPLSRADPRRPAESRRRSVPE